MASRYKAITAILALLAAAGCASATRDDERTLAAAGFQMKTASTPEQQAKLASLPQRTLTPVSREGETMYVYADAQYCNCLYVGTEAAYDRYQNLSLRQEIAEEEEMASMDWGPWGGWDPWW